MYPSATGPRLLEPSSGRGASEAKRAECQLGPRSLGQTVLWPPSRRPTCFPFHELPGLLWELCSLSVQRMPGLWSLLLTVGLLEGLRGAQSCVPPPGARNWARGRPAAQSSTYPQWGDVYSLAGSAVDGNRDGDWRHGSCSHTTAEEEPWWSLDLGAPYAIAAVVVKNRQECCSERIEGAQIRVGDCGAQHGKHNPICGTITNGSAGSLSIVCCDGLQGRYVTVVIPGRAEYLTLCELEVYGSRVRKGC